MRLLEPLPTGFLRRLNIIKIVGLVIFLSSTIYTSYTLGYLEAEKTSNELYGKVWASHMYFPNIINSIRAIITLCVAVGVLGIWTKRIIGVIVSLVAYVGIMATYLWWYKISLDFLSGVELPRFTPEINHFGPLKDATLLDAIILIFAMCSVAWLITILLKIWQTIASRQPNYRTKA